MFLIAAAGVASITPAPARPHRAAPSLSRAHTHARALFQPGGIAWYGLFFHTEKIGYANVVTEAAHVANRPAVSVESQTEVKMKLLGVEVSQDVDQVDLYTPAGKPLQTSFVTRSGGKENRVTATYGPHSIACVLGDGQRKVVPIPAGVTLGASDDFSVDPGRLKPGATWNEYYFNPATLAVEKFTAVVHRPASGAAVSPAAAHKAVWEVDGRSAIGSMNMLVDRQGGMVEASMPLGIRMEKETRAAARAGADYHPVADLARAGAIEVAQPIDRPREVDQLDLVISGVPADSRIPTGPGQTAVNAGGGRWAVHIFRTPEPGSSVRLPEARPTEALASTSELPADNPELESAARGILKGETDALKAVRLLHDWVNLHMQARYDIGVIRSGSDVLHDRVGVCRDYAVLYTSLARAAGIPTRICSGLVYWQGKFYYHAWAESDVGSWVRVDATMPTEMVDATHVTLARGDARSMYGATALVGMIHIAVKKVGYSEHTSGIASPRTIDKD